MKRTTIIIVAFFIIYNHNNSSGSMKRVFGLFPQVVLKRNRLTKAFRDGGQLIFGNAVQTNEKISRDMKSHDLVHVLVQDKEQGGTNEQPIGFGMYNPNSLYRIRLLCHQYLQPQLYADILDSSTTTTTTDAVRKVLDYHFRIAQQTRAQYLNLPNEETNTYRLINGEGDGLSGLAVDVIDDVVVVMSSAGWIEKYKGQVLESLQTFFPESRLVWKVTQSRLDQDGWTAPPVESNSSNDEKTENETEHVLSKENGILYQVYPFQTGQKTGVYCDQRENRAYFGSLCKGKRVLDLCCYHGGFSLNAAKNGAVKTVGVDSSQDAIDACRRNAELNGFSSDQVEFVRADVASFLKESEDTFDVIVLDPPKLAPSVKSLDKAQRKYQSLNRAAIRLLRDGGLLMTCTCSAAMTQDPQRFLTTVQQAAGASRTATLLKVNGAAPCHPTSPICYPAGQYLTAALFRIA